ncbi:hypothetical protein ABT256_14350 [Amycolatopsis japonica]
MAIDLDAGRYEHIRRRRAYRCAIKKNLKKAEFSVEIAEIARPSETDSSA